MGGWKGGGKGEESEITGDGTQRGKASPHVNQETKMLFPHPTFVGIIQPDCAVLHVRQQKPLWPSTHTLQPAASTLPSLRDCLNQHKWVASQQKACCFSPISQSPSLTHQLLQVDFVLLFLFNLFLFLYCYFYWQLSSLNTTETTIEKMHIVQTEDHKLFKKFGFAHQDTP